MLFSLNMPMCGTKMAETFFHTTYTCHDADGKTVTKTFTHPMVAHLNSQHNFFNPSGVSETSYGAACDS